MRTLVLGDAGESPLALMGAIRVIYSKFIPDIFIASGTGGFPATLLALGIPIPVIIEELENSSIIREILGERSQGLLSSLFFSGSSKKENTSMRRFTDWVEKILKNCGIKPEITFSELPEKRNLILTVENVSEQMIYTLSKERTPNMSILVALAYCMLRYPIASTYTILISLESENEDDYFELFRKVQIDSSGFLMPYPISLANRDVGREVIGVCIKINSELYGINSSSAGLKNDDLTSLWRKRNQMPGYYPNTICVNMTACHDKKPNYSREILEKGERAAKAYFET